MTFEFATAGRVIFGCGTVRQLPGLCREFGRRVLVVTGSRPERFQPVLAALESSGLSVTGFAVTGEPTTDRIRQGTRHAREHGAEVIIGLGGGSVVDAAKAIAALATQPGDLFDYLEVVGRGKPLDAVPLPNIAVPTTAGTGAEATRNAVIASPEHGVKVSLRHHSMLPTIALVDPELTVDCPPAVTAASGMDALVQCLEAYVSNKAQPLTDALCLEGIRRVLRSLETAVKDGSLLSAREDLSLAALFSGMALANAGLGAVHGFAAPIGGQFHAPHGAICAALLAPVWKANLRHLSTAGQTGSLERFRVVADLLGSQGIPISLESSGSFFWILAKRLSIPGLGAYGIDGSHLDEIARKAAASSSMKGNPVTLKHDELVAILASAL